MDGLADSGFVVRPVDVERFTEDFVAGNRPPVTAIPAVIAIVAHGEVRVWKNAMYELVDDPCELAEPQ
jgi:hypothetical protein